MHDREQAARRATTIALRVATALLRNRDDAADVAQDVAVEVLRSLDRLRDWQAFDAWARRIAVRHTVRALRERQRRDGSALAALAAAGEEAAAVVDVDLLLSSRHALTDALAALPPRQAIALVLRYVHDLSDREIADALGCRRGTANALLSRGRAALREVPELRALASGMEATR